MTGSATKQSIFRLGDGNWLRYAAVAAGFAAFMVTRRSTLAGVVCGELMMLAGKWWLG
jgi:hypothetical protein